MKRLLPALLAAGTLGLAACGSSETESTPTACLAGADAYLAALEAAPDAALLDGSVPIGDCIVPDQSPGEISTVGGALLTATTRLNREARRMPAGEAAIELGYLIGSVEEAASGTEGIHTDLVRRLNGAARFNQGGEPLPARFERAFGAGYAAAREPG